MTTKKIPETDEEKRAREVVEEIACTIANLSRQVDAILAGRMKKKSIVLLLAHSTKMTQSQVENVLDAIVNLETTHLK